MKLKVLLVLACVLAAVGFGVVWSGKKTNVQMNNETCPVSGNPVNDHDTYVHQGKEYKLCSEPCKKSLSENPDKYLSN